MGNIFGKEEEVVVGLPETKELCLALESELVYWDNGKCKNVDKGVITKLNACNKSGSHFDFTDNACKSNLDVVPRCKDGGYWHKTEGELGKCVSREELCKFKDVTLEGFSAVETTRPWLFYFIIIVMGLYCMRRKKKSFLFF